MLPWSIQEESNDRKNEQKKDGKGIIEVDHVRNLMDGWPQKKSNDDPGCQAAQYHFPLEFPKVGPTVNSSIQPQEVFIK